MPATELLRPAFSKPMTHSSREQITTGLDFIRKRGTCKKACAGRTFFLRALAARRLDSTRHLELPHLRTAQSNLFPALSQRLPSALSQRLLRAFAAPSVRSRSAVSRAVAAPFPCALTARSWHCGSACQRHHSAARRRACRCGRRNLPGLKGRPC